MSNTAQERLCQLKRDLKVAAAGLIGAFLINFGYVIVLMCLHPGLSPTAIDNLAKTWRFDLRSLPDDSYFLAAGRATGPCDLSLDGRIVATTRSLGVAGMEQLSLGAGFIKSGRTPQEALITCSAQAGFAAGLTQAPLILPYGSGRLLQAYFEFMSIWLGVLVGAYALGAIYMLTPDQGAAKPNSTSGFRNARKSVKDFVLQPYLLLAACIFAYGISLSYAGWLLLPSQVATALHIAIRIALSFAFVNLGNHISQVRRPFRWLYSALLVGHGIAWALSWADAVLLVNLYKCTYFLFSAATCLVWWDLLHAGHKTRPVLLFSSLSLLWAVAQLSDFVGVLVAKPIYSGPVILAGVAILIVRVRREDVNLTVRVERVASTVLQATTTKNLPIDMLIRQACAVIAQETHFTRQSVYVDAYSLGRSARPHHLLLRVFEFGYEKNTHDDFEIDLSQGRGRVMADASRRQEVVTGRGKDNGYFCVIPCGSLACINLSDAVSMPERLVQDSLAVVQRLRPVVGMLGDRAYRYQLAAQRVFAAG